MVFVPPSYSVRSFSCRISGTIERRIGWQNTVGRKSWDSCVWSQAKEDVHAHLWCLPVVSGWVYNDYSLLPCSCAYPRFLFLYADVFSVSKQIWPVRNWYSMKSYVVRYPVPSGASTIFALDSTCPSFYSCVIESVLLCCCVLSVRVIL